MNNTPIRFVGFDAEFAIKEILELSIFSLGYHTADSSDESVSDSIDESASARESKEIFHEYFKPRNETHWPGSQRVHHISPAMVRHRPGFIKFRPTVQRLIDEADCLVGFAIDNDIEALRFAGVHGLDDKPVIDIRDLHWLCHGRDAGVALDSRRGLSVTAGELGIDFNETDAHGASYDTLKTMECLNVLLKQFEEKYPSDSPLLAHYLQVWDTERENYYREYAKGWVAIVESGDGYRIKTSRMSPPEGDKVVAVIPVNARHRALDEIDARYDKRRHRLDRKVYMLTKADIEWFKAYTNEYDGQEHLHRKMQELRSANHQPSWRV
ncbi:MAG: hypothetical protein K2O24_02030 [Muribaculaceae bacterium]|nr:hypothetical protein [Muribaculaceae bacterium]